MPSPIVGLHHVTAIASDPQRNLDFYTEVLGLRFVKRTVNFDDPGTYHFYFGDDLGSPGTILTFFPWPKARRGVAGAGEVAATGFRVPAGSLDFWEKRLAGRGVPVEDGGTRLGEEVLGFADPDGLRLELVGVEGVGEARASRYSGVGDAEAIRGFSGVTLLEHDGAKTKALLGVMGYSEVREERGRVRLTAQGSKAPGNHVDLVVDPRAGYGVSGAGTVHHIAFRAADDQEQGEWREVLGEHVEVTPVMDRTYFHSIYFREPGGVLFELATDPPGFLLDEPAESLGEALRIPEWLEPRREWVEARLPPLALHKAAGAAV